MKIEINNTDEITGKRLTKKQLKLLIVLNPLNGHKLQKEAAEELGVSLTAINHCMSRIKKRCPQVYKNFIKLKKTLNNRDNKRKFDNPIKVSQLCTDSGQNECFDYLNTKETF